MLSTKTEQKDRSDEDYMRLALAQAKKAGALGDVPVGAVIVKQGRVIAADHNRVEQRGDSTAHAEMLAVRQAQRVTGYARLVGCTLYVTKEPCPMCSGAVVLARLDRVVFGIGDTKQGGCGGAFSLAELPGLNHQCEIARGILANEALALLQEFFQKARRAARQRRAFDLT